METNQNMRQQKIARQIQRDMAEILQKEGAAIVAGRMVTVTTVRVSPDFAYAKRYVVPELQFFLDDSLEYIENIDSLLNK